jgi:hypothetical protein
MSCLCPVKIFDLVDRKSSLRTNIKTNNFFLRHCKVNIVFHVDEQGGAGGERVLQQRERPGTERHHGTVPRLLQGAHHRLS